MRVKKELAAGVAFAMGMLALSGCSHAHGLTLANEITFAPEGLSEITISYDEESVTFYESENGAVTVREYMTENKKSYYARMEKRDGSIKISEGGKPFFKNGFTRCVEVYLPESYHESLSVTTTDGNIDISKPELSLTALFVDSTAGTVKLGAVEAKNIWLSSSGGAYDIDSLEAEKIKIDITSGSLSCERLDGDVAYTTTSGSADIRAASGLGSYRAENSGELRVAYNEVLGDLSFYNKNGDIYVELPGELDFYFDAATKNGSVSTNFQESIFSDPKTARSAIGEEPSVTVKAETKNGNIEVRR